jgi:hypothetical protein
MGQMIYRGVLVETHGFPATPHIAIIHNAPRIIWTYSRVGRRAVTTRSFCMLAAAIFALITLLQLLRIFMEWSVTLNGVVIPFWASWIAVIVACALSLVGFRSATRS